MSMSYVVCRSGLFWCGRSFLQQNVFFFCVRSYISHCGNVEDSFPASLVFKFWLQLYSHPNALLFIAVYSRFLFLVFSVSGISAFSCLDSLLFSFFFFNRTIKKKKKKSMWTMVRLSFVLIRIVCSRE